MVTLLQQAKYSDAIEIGERARRLREEVLGRQHPLYAESLNSLGVIYNSAHQRARGASLHEDALRIRRTTLGDDHYAVAVSLINLASLHRGRASESLSMRIEAVAILKNIVGELHPNYARGLNSLGLAYQIMEDYVAAARHFRGALEIFRQTVGETHPAYATSVQNLAYVYDASGDYARAEPLFLEALQLEKNATGEVHPSYAVSLHNLARMYYFDGQLERAEALLLRAIEIRRQVFGDGHPSNISALQHLAAVYDRLRQPERAEPLYRQALSIRKETGAVRTEGYARNLSDLAGLYLDQGDFAQAQRLYGEALEIRKHYSQDNWSHGRLLNNIAGLHAGMGNVERAETLYKQAMDIQRANLDRAALVQSARQQVRNQAVLRFYLDTRVANALAGGVDIDGPLEGLWQWKGAVTSRQTAYRRVAAHPELAPLFTQLQQVSRDLSAHLTRIPAPAAAEATDAERLQRKELRAGWNDRFKELNIEREELEEQIASDSIEFKRSRDLLRVADVRAWLPPRTAFIDLLEYRHSTRSAEQDGVVHERRFCAFVIRADRDPVLVGLGNSRKVEEAITEFRRPFEPPARGEGRGESNAAVGKTLRRLLWHPLQEHLDGIETVIISPDTVLGTLPFAALPGQEKGSYLIEEYKFASLPMANMLDHILAEKSDRKLPGKGLLVLGDVDYDADSKRAGAPRQQSWARSGAPRSGDMVWEPRRGFQLELAIVRDEFEKNFGGGVTTLRSAQATEAEFMRLAPNHYNLHLVTHGYFAKPNFTAISDTSPDQWQDQVDTDRTVDEYLPGLLSGLVLAGANNPVPADDPAADGILTAAEIETLNLSRVDLVVLAACETGLGRVAGGEGLTGLQRAFHIAGARSCLATLWKVDDKATQEIMSLFYNNYWAKGQSRVDALRNAQLTILRNPRLVRGSVVRRQKLRAPAESERTSPYFWAPFQLSGDWR